MFCIKFRRKEKIQHNVMKHSCDLCAANIPTSSSPQLGNSSQHFSPSPSNVFSVVMISTAPMQQA